MKSRFIWHGASALALLCSGGVAYFVLHEAMKVVLSAENLSTGSAEYRLGSKLIIAFVCVANLVPAVGHFYLMGLKEKIGLGRLTCFVGMITNAPIGIILAIILCLAILNAQQLMNVESVLWALFYGFVWTLSYFLSFIGFFRTLRSWKGLGNGPIADQFS
jgi:hypothetical protein